MSTPPTLTRSTFHVWLQPEGATEPAVHRVMVRNGDQLRAELEANRLRLPGLKDAPLHATSLWIWAACAREGLTQAKALDFIGTELVAYRPVEEEPKGGSPVDPTEEPSGSVSHLPTPLAVDSPTGWTQT
jgi:hypothetical protein